MPYYFFEEEMLADDCDQWTMLQSIWDTIHYDLAGLHFETEQEALDQKYRKSLDPNDMRPDTWHVARYRETD